MTQQVAGETKKSPTKGAHITSLEELQRFVFGYELVRRVHKLWDNPVALGIVTSAQARLIRKAKPWNDLDLLDRRYLQLRFHVDLRRRPIATTVKALADQLGEYSEPFPSVRFDLHAAPETLKKTIVKWIGDQRIKAGMTRGDTRRGPTGTSRNRDQRYKTPSWKYLEWLDNLRAVKLKSKGYLSTVLKRLRKEVVGYLPTVIAWLDSRSNTLLHQGEVGADSFTSFIEV